MKYKYQIASQNITLRTDETGFVMFINYTSGVIFVSRYLVTNSFKLINLYRTSKYLNFRNLNCNNAKDAMITFLSFMFI